MLAHESPAYNDALRTAARRAYEARNESTSPDGFYPPCFAVYFDGTAMYVRDTKAAKPRDAALVCIAQFWSGNTVQLRFAGAHSEYINF